jgi:hypothetical protein
MVESQRDFAREIAERIALASSLLAQSSGDWQKVCQKVSMSKTSWLLATPLGDFDQKTPLPGRPSEYTVLASDGSQIYPDRHESFPCYLINIGSVVLGYGARAQAVLSSTPRFYFSEEDRFTVWDGKRVMVTPEVISVKRAVMELEELLALSQGVDGIRVALCDGSLILWTLEGAPADFREATLERLSAALEGFRRAGVPLVGYISLPGSTDVINTLRLWLCPEEVSYCSRCPYAGQPQLPCQPIEGVADRSLFSLVLYEGERSQIFKSSSKILEFYGESAVCFFYLNTGDEIVRVEVPKWLAEDKELLDITHAVVFDQAKKGGGYPVALVEAHEQAVIRGKDREFFFDLLRESLVKSDLKVTLSRKGISKRRPIV